MMYFPWLDYQFRRYKIWCSEFGSKIPTQAKLCEVEENYTWSVKEEGTSLMPRNPKQPLSH